MKNENTVLIDTVIIPVGGYGTRMGETTKAVPKALLPVGDRPLIVHAVDEAIASGATRVIIPCRPDDVELFQKQFYGNGSRDKIIEQNGRNHLLSNRELHTQVEIVAIYAKEGPASTIAQLVSERSIGAFGVILPDDLMVDRIPVLKQMIDNFHNNRVTNIGARQACLETENPNNVTFVKMQTLDDGTQITNTIQIKPGKDSPVSNDATCGRYIFDEFFADMVEDCDKIGLKEVSMSAVIRHYAENGGVNVTQLNSAKFYDCGDPVGYYKAQAAFMPPHILMDAFTKATQTELIMQVRLSAPSSDNLEISS